MSTALGPTGPNPFKTTGEKMKPKHAPTGSNGPTVAVETITPAQAHALLGGNTHNRLVSSRVKDLARAAGRLPRTSLGSRAR